MTTGTPDLVSVIIPTYNRADLLMQALDTVQRQTWPHVQIIVVDDGSTDDTQARMAAIPGICYVRQPNKGQAAARNEGLRHAEGAYICSLDSDDLWQPEFLETCVTALRELGAGFVFANWTGLGLNGEKYPSSFERHGLWKGFAESRLPGWRLMEAERSCAVYVDVCISPSSSIVMRRDVLPFGWTETFKIADDWCMLLDAVIGRSCPVAFTMEPLWVKRVVGDNIYDKRNYLELRRDFYVHDYRLILQRFEPRMTRRERALWYGRLALNQAMLAKSDGKRRRFASAAALVGRAALALVRACLLSPGLGLEALSLILRGEATGLWMNKPIHSTDTFLLEREG